MSAVKAYLSDRDGGPTFLDGDTLAHSDGRTFRNPGPREDAFAAAWAVREAWAILEETETVGGCMPLSCFLGRLANVRPEDVFHYPSAVVQPREALKVALAAFVREG